MDDVVINAFAVPGIEFHSGAFREEITKVVAMN